jgi:hypothetical protein
MKRFFLMFGLVTVLAVVAVSLGGCGDQNGTVQGTVTQAKDPNKPADDPPNVGQGISQAEVNVFALEKIPGTEGLDVYKKGPMVYQAVTDENGAFSFPLVTGKYLIETSVKDLKRVSRQMEVKGRQTTIVNFNLLATP